MRYWLILWIMTFPCYGSAINYHHEKAPITKGQFLTSFQRVAEFWKAQCNKDFYLVGSDAFIDLQWGDLPEGRTGATTIHFIGATKYYSVTLSKQLDERTIDKILAHELGHVLGLEHTSDRHSLMHPEVLGNQLSREDLMQCRE